MDLRYRNDFRAWNGLDHAPHDTQMDQRLTGFRAEFRTELQQLRWEIQQVRTELYRDRLELPCWLFGFWIAAVVGAAVLAFAVR